MTEHHLSLDALAKPYLDGEHSVFSPSGSKMWLLCSGSLIPNMLAPDAAGYEAVEGTVAHAVAEEWLKSGDRPDERIGEVVKVVEHGQEFEVEITKSMLDYLEVYVSGCSYMPGESAVESRVYFDDLTPLPRQGGTADHISMEQGVLTLSDLKYGQGVPVYAAENIDDPRTLIDGELNGNPQLLLYGYGAFREWDWLYDFQRIVLRIYQPRRDNVSVWETTRDELIKFAQWVKERAALAWQHNAPRKPSEDSCKFCKVKNTCPAFLDMFHSIASECFDDLDEPISVEQMTNTMTKLDNGEISTTFVKPIELTSDQLAKLLPFRSVIEGWFAAVEKELEKRAIEGESITGHKLVEARTNRKFQEEDKVVSLLAEAGISWVDLYKVSFISPAQAEELLRETGFKKADAVKYLDPVVFKAAGKPTLVPLSDKRPVYTNHADEGVFDDL